MKEGHHMKNAISIILAAAFVVALVPSRSFAQDHPVQLALFNPVQIVSEKESVSGLRLSLIYGANENVTGLDWGLVTKTSGMFKGIQWGGVGMVEKDFEGWQWNLVSLTRGSM